MSAVLAGLRMAAYAGYDQAAQALRRWRWPAGAPALVDALAPPQTHSVESALRAIPAAATEACLDALADPRPRVRAGAVKVLGSLGTETMSEVVEVAIRGRALDEEASGRGQVLNVARRRGWGDLVRALSRA